ncbi:hypothetical protein T439DRAFT_354018 [Meredithblackwellia eburnea MCA 4105]
MPGQVADSERRASPWRTKPNEALPPTSSSCILPLASDLIRMGSTHQQDYVPHEHHPAHLNDSPCPIPVLVLTHDNPVRDARNFLKTIFKYIHNGDLALTLDSFRAHCESLDHKFGDVRSAEVDTSLTVYHKRYTLKAPLENFTYAVPLSFGLSSNLASTYQDTGFPLSNARSGLKLIKEDLYNESGGKMFTLYRQIMKSCQEKISDFAPKEVWRFGCWLEFLARHLETALEPDAESSSLRVHDKMVLELIRGKQSLLKQVFPRRVEGGRLPPPPCLVQLGTSLQEFRHWAAQAEMLLDKVIKELDNFDKLIADYFAIQTKIEHVLYAPKLVDALRNHSASVLDQETYLDRFLEDPKAFHWDIQHNIRIMCCVLNSGAMLVERCGNVDETTIEHTKLELENSPLENATLLALATTPPTRDRHTFDPSAMIFRLRCWRADALRTTPQWTFCKSLVVFVDFYLESLPFARHLFICQHQTGGYSSIERRLLYPIGNFASHVERKVYPEERSTFGKIGPEGERMVSPFSTYITAYEQSTLGAALLTLPGQAGLTAKISTPPGQPTGGTTKRGRARARFLLLLPLASSLSILPLSAALIVMSSNHGQANTQNHQHKPAYTYDSPCPIPPLVLTPSDPVGDAKNFIKVIIKFICDGELGSMLDSSRAYCESLDRKFGAVQQAKVEESLIYFQNFWRDSSSFSWDSRDLNRKKNLLSQLATIIANLKVGKAKLASPRQPSYSVEFSRLDSRKGPQIGVIHNLLAQCLRQLGSLEDEFETISNVLTEVTQLRAEVWKIPSWCYSLYREYRLRYILELPLEHFTYAVPLPFGFTSNSNSTYKDSGSPYSNARAGLKLIKDDLCNKGDRHIITLYLKIVTSCQEKVSDFSPAEVKILADWLETLRNDLRADPKNQLDSEKFDKNTSQLLRRIKKHRDRLWKVNPDATRDPPTRPCLRPLENSSQAFGDRVAKAGESLNKVIKEMDSFNKLLNEYITIQNKIEHVLYAPRLVDALRNHSASVLDQEAYLERFMKDPRAFHWDM